MPYRMMEENDWLRWQSRILNAGDPYSGKTGSFLTWPRPLHAVISPGEQGAGAIRHDPAAGVFVHIFDLDPKERSSQVTRQVMDRTVEIIAGTYGPVQTLAVDGVHKLSDFYLDAATNGDYFSGEEFEPRLYVAARRELINYMNKCRFSGVQNVVFTCWAGPERDTAKKEEKSTHIWPDLPGQLAKRILGEYTAVLYARVIAGEKPGDPPRYVWQLKPDNEIWGCGIKAPKEISEKLPKYIPQDWRILMATLAGDVSHAVKIMARVTPPAPQAAVPLPLKPGVPPATRSMR